MEAGGGLGQASISRSHFRLLHLHCPACTVIDSLFPVGQHWRFYLIAWYISDILTS